VVREEFRQAEIENLRLPALGDEDVSGLDVPMNNAFRMGGVERIGNLDAELEDFVRLERLTGDMVLKGFAHEKLHGDEWLTFGLVNIVNCANVGVIQRRGGLGFALESREC
jgi:hypothetical protein